jgi:hypothetical protein
MHKSLRKFKMLENEIFDLFDREGHDSGSFHSNACYISDGTVEKRWCPVMSPA